MFRGFASRESQPHMIPDVVQNMFGSNLAACRQKIAAHVAADEAEQEIRRAVEHQQPGEKEMPATSGREPLPARKRSPMREAVSADRQQRPIGAGSELSPVQPRI